jgi:hypothetical protein
MVSLLWLIEWGVAITWDHWSINRGDEWNADWKERNWWIVILFVYFVLWKSVQRFLLLDTYSFGGVMLFSVCILNVLPISWYYIVTEARCNLYILNINMFRLSENACVCFVQNNLPNVYNEVPVSHLHHGRLMGGLDSYSVTEKLGHQPMRVHPRPQTNQRNMILLY